MDGKILELFVFCHFFKDGISHWDLASLTMNVGDVSNKVIASNDENVDMIAQPFIVDETNPTVWYSL